MSLHSTTADRMTNVFASLQWSPKAFDVKRKHAGGMRAMVPQQQPRNRAHGAATSREVKFFQGRSSPTRN